MLTIHANWNINDFFYNLGQNIWDKFTTLSGKGFSKECFTAGLCNFVAELSKFSF